VGSFVVGAKNSNYVVFQLERDTIQAVTKISQERIENGNTKREL
jgi:hypothetical protein